MPANDDRVTDVIRLGRDKMPAYGQVLTQQPDQRSAGLPAYSLITSATTVYSPRSPRFNLLPFLCLPCALVVNAFLRAFGLFSTLSAFLSFCLSSVFPCAAVVKLRFAAPMLSERYNTLVAAAVTPALNEAPSFRQFTRWQRILLWMIEWTGFLIIRLIGFHPENCYLLGRRLAGLTPSPPLRLFLLAYLHDSGNVSVARPQNSRHEQR